MGLDIFVNRRFIYSINLDAINDQIIMVFYLFQNQIYRVVSYSRMEDHGRVKK